MYGSGDRDTSAAKLTRSAPRRNGLPGAVDNRRDSVYPRGMTVQTFRELLTRQPFMPFRIVMSSGQAYEVRHPEMALLTRTDLLVGIDETKDGVPARFKICSLLHVTAVEPLESPKPADTA